MRTATHSFQYKRNKESPYLKYSTRNKIWRGGFGQQVLGDTWISHHGHHKRESTRGVIEEKYAELALRSLHAAFLEDGAAEPSAE